MSTYLLVTAGIDMSRALGGKRMTKKWLRDYLRDNPQKDFRILEPGRGGYVNGGDAIRHGDLTLEVREPSTLSFIGMVNFQATDSNEWHYQAVVR